MAALPQQQTTALRPLSRRDEFAQAIVTAVLYIVPALICAHLACVSDPDIWWHLRSGEWIAQHRAVPHTDPFSSYGAGRPWAAYSWLFEVIVLQLFQRFGLVGIVVYSTGMVLAITAALHHLIKRLQADFTVAVLITLVASLSVGRLYTPRPWHFTIFFFVLELDILMHARKTGKLKELLWLPVIFAVWANVHIQFLNGLIVLALACFEAIAAKFWPAAKTRLKFAGMLAMLLIFGGSALATLANPYGWGIYRIAHDLAAQPGVFDHITELQAIPFRGLPDYCVLALTLGSVVVLARARRVRVFETLLLAFALVLSFRSQRDVWVMAAAASAIIAPGVVVARTQAVALERRRSVLAWSAMPATVAIVLIAAFRILHVTNTRLAAQLATELPVGAVQAVQRAGYAGPVYNDYGWGGYLMWGLHEPVSIDGRAALHGTERLDRFSATWNAAPDWSSDTELAAAGVVIGPVKAPLTQVLRLDARYQLAYEDKVAAVFVPSRAGGAQPQPQPGSAALASLR